MKSTKCRVTCEMIKTKNILVSIKMKAKNPKIKHQTQNPLG